MILQLVHGPVDGGGGLADPFPKGCQFLVSQHKLTELREGNQWGGSMPAAMATSTAAPQYRSPLRAAHPGGACCSATKQHLLVKWQCALYRPLLGPLYTPHRQRDKHRHTV